MKRLIVCIVIVLSSLLTANAIGEETKTLVAAADPWPPFIDPQNPKEGLSLEIVRAAFKTQGYEIKMEYVPWARAESGVKNGIYDILPDVWMTEARKKELMYSVPYAKNEVKFITLLDKILDRYTR
ncbi:MAG: transporter substrate-binding domain-containing protein [Desulfobacterales bacterium]|nr:transporter substrate-binding domain-containing protein [Desulfobacterales bacterium]